MAKETGDVTDLGIFGDKKYQARARRALPLLVRQAKAEQPIYYSSLAEELGIPNPRNLNYVLGAIGNELLMLSEKWDLKVPPIQTLVVNKDTDLPGEGISFFTPDATDFKNATRSQRRVIVDGMLQNVYSFDQWDAVLYDLELESAEGPAFPFGPSKPPIQPRGGRGESEAHRKLKEVVAGDPSVVGLRKSIGEGEIEFLFGSGDAIDVLFRNGKEWVGVEVKAAEAATYEVARGLFQCVKYLALLEATLRFEQEPINARAVLALGGPLPRSLVGLRNTLGVKVVDSISA